MPMLTYIATDESNTTNLNYLSSQHDYKLFNSLLGDRDVVSWVSLLHASKSKNNASLPLISNSTINAADAFVLELMLMIDSTYFFAWGGELFFPLRLVVSLIRVDIDTSVNRFVYRSRYLDKSRKRVSIFDGVDYSLIYKHAFHQAD
jgi:hypothetical protein